MNFPAGIADHPLAQRVGWVLLHSLWQGALVGAAFELARHGLRRRSAEVRYVAGCLALLLVAAGAAATFCLWPAPVGPGDAGLVAPGGPARFSPASGLGGNAWPIGDGAYSLFRMGMDFCGRLAPWLAGAWSLGVAMCLLRLTRGCLWVRRTRRRETEPVEPVWLEILEDLRLRLEISRPVRLFKSALVEVPTVIGWIRPIILLPAAALAGLAPEQLEAILAHELAHARRFDYLVNICQCVIETLMFYHPAVWWVSRCVREERENCCDDMVVRVCGNRLAYARALATLAESGAGLPEWAFAASGGPLLARVRRLLGVGTESGAGGTRHLGGLSLLTFGLPLILAGVCLVLSTPCFEARSRIRIIREGTGPVTLAEGPIGSGSCDPYFLQTELEVIQSELILGRVVDKMSLQQEWGKTYARGGKLSRLEAVNLLKGRMSLRSPRKTTIIEIRACSQSPEEASRIANCVSEVYGEYCQPRMGGRTKSSIDFLLTQREAKETEIAAAQNNLQRLRLQLNISDSMADENAAAPAITAETLRQINRLRIETQAECLREETLLADLKRLRAEDRIQALLAAAQDTLLSSLLEQKGLADQRLLAAGRDFGPGHPDVVKARASMADLEEKINRRAEGDMLGLETKVHALGMSLTNLNEQLARATQEDIDKANRSQPYFDARRRLEELIKFRAVLDGKIAVESTGPPPRIGVEIIDMAAPPQRPASPNRTVAATLVGSGLFLDALGMLMLRAGRKRTLIPG